MSSVFAIVTGVATAFGLTASGIVLGGILARLLDVAELLPDGYAPVAWLVLSVVGTLGAGATVADVAGAKTSAAVGIAGTVLFVSVFEVMRSVETTGAEGAELPLVVFVAALFVGLLGAGARLYRRSSNGTGRRAVRAG